MNTLGCNVTGTVLLDYVFEDTMNTVLTLFVPIEKKHNEKFAGTEFVEIIKDMSSS